MLARLLRSLLLVGLAAGASLSWAAALAQAPTPSGVSLSVSPPKTELILSPGGEANSSASVINLSPGTAVVHASVWDFKVTDTTGTVSLLEPSASNPQGLAADITLTSPDTFTLATNAKMVLSYKVKIPVDAPGGSLFGAIVFSSGPPPEKGKVAIVSEVVSLVVARVQGINLSTLPSSTTAITLSLPVREEAGRKVVELYDPVTKLDVTTQANATAISLPVKDLQNVQQGTLTAESQTGVVGTGNGAVATVDKLLVRSNTWQVNVGAEGSQAQTATVQVSFQMKSLPPGSAAYFEVAAKPDQETQEAIQSAAGDVAVANVAYVVKVNKQNIKDATEVVNGVLTLGVSRAWADQYDASLVRIVRQADDGSVQVLDTQFKGYDGDTATFVADSPQGLSTFSLVAFAQPVAPVNVPAPPTPPPTPVAPPQQGPNVFGLILTTDVTISAQATATDDQGNPVQVVPGQAVTQNTTIVPPSQTEVNVKIARSVQSGTLNWVKAPGLVMAGSNMLTLHFENTGDGDYQTSPGMATVVDMGGKVQVNMQVPNFNSFPKGGRDLQIEWITPSSALGRYTIAAQAGYGDPPQMAFSQPITVWVVPWKWLLSILLTVLGLFALAWLVIRSVKDYVDRQVKKRVTQSGKSGPDASSGTRSRSAGPVGPDRAGDMPGRKAGPENE